MRSKKFLINLLIISGGFSILSESVIAILLYLDINLTAGNLKILIFILYVFYINIILYYYNFKYTFRSVKLLIIRILTISTVFFIFGKILGYSLLLAAGISFTSILCDGGSMGINDGTVVKCCVAKGPSIDCAPEIICDNGDFTCKICTTDCSCFLSTKAKDGSDAVVKEQPSRIEKMEYKPQNIANKNVDSPAAPSTDTSEASKPAADKISPNSNKSVHFDSFHKETKVTISSDFSNYDNILQDTPCKVNKTEIYKGKGKVVEQEAEGSNANKSHKTSSTGTTSQLNTPSETVRTNPKIRDSDDNISGDNGSTQANLPGDDVPLQEQTPLNIPGTTTVNSNSQEARFIDGE
jgi:hypothetical protein